MALRLDGNELSALPANKLSQVWDWIASSPGFTSLRGQWTLTFLDEGSFFGVEQGVGFQGLSAISGQLGPDTHFIAQRVFIDPLGTKGTVLYQGTLSREGDTVTINGTRTIVSVQGTVTSVRSFRATRSY